MSGMKILRFAAKVLDGLLDAGTGYEDERWHRHGDWGCRTEQSSSKGRVAGSTPARRT
jgi:hypothetical protein